jgi:hypothetical protein
MEFNFITLSVIVGSFLPLVISLVKGANMTTQWKRAIAVLVSALAAFVTVGAENGWVFGSDLWTNLFQSFGVIFALAQTTYTGFWEDTAIEVKLEDVGSNMPANA